MNSGYANNKNDDLITVVSKLIEKARCVNVYCNMAFFIYVKGDMKRKHGKGQEKYDPIHVQNGEARFM